jgi:predicted 3-demethylubiquinone-9 3-methyltransferase (glyoxalase superfamily)
MHASFSLAGQPFMAMDSNREHPFTFSPAISLFVECETQSEIDWLWERLSDGGKTNQCGWLDDRFGVSWQIVPAILGHYVSDSAPDKANRAMEAMLAMTKLDIADLQRAYDGN